MTTSTSHQGQFMQVKPLQQRYQSCTPMRCTRCQEHLAQAAVAAQLDPMTCQKCQELQRCPIPPRCHPCPRPSLRKWLRSERSSWRGNAPVRACAETDVHLCMQTLLCIVWRPHCQMSIGVDLSRRLGVQEMCLNAGCQKCSRAVGMRKLHLARHAQCL